MDYNLIMIEIVKSDTFDQWLHGLKDRVARATDRGAHCQDGTG